MKKVLAVVLTVCVVFGTAAAFAQPKFEKDFEGREHRNLQQMKHPDFLREQRFEGCGFGAKKHRRNFTPDMPKEIREKAAELAKLRVDLEEALSDNPINKTKAVETHKKMQVLRNEIDSWKFEKKLERMAEMRKFMQERHEKFQKNGEQKETEEIEEVEE